MRKTKPCRCTSTSPFRVEVDGVPMDAMRLDGQTWQVGDLGRAIWDPPAMPVCLKTTR